MMAQAGNKEGSFLVRDHSRSPGDFVLSVYQGTKPQHYVVQAKTGVFSIDDGPRYNNLADLIEFYMNDPASPTKLTQPICRPGTSMAAWNAGGDAPPPVPRASYRAGGGGGGGGADSPYGNVEKGKGGMSSIKGRASRTSPAPAASSGGGGSSGLSDIVVDDNATLQEQIAAAKGDYRENARVKAIHAAQNAVDDVVVEEREVLQTSGAETANEMAFQFEKEAVATEKLNIFWLNKKLKELGKEPKPDLTESLKDGVAMIQVMELVSGKKAPKYAKMARMDIQKQDNWSCLVGFMRKIGIVVDEIFNMNAKEDEAASPSLNPLFLFQLDRREHIKLFTKIMLYENMLVDQREAETN